MIDHKPMMRHCCTGPGWRLPETTGGCQHGNEVVLRPMACPMPH